MGGSLWGNQKSKGKNQKSKMEEGLLLAGSAHFCLLSFDF